MRRWHLWGVAPVAGEATSGKEATSGRAARGGGELGEPADGCTGIVEAEVGKFRRRINHRAEGRAGAENRNIEEVVEGAEGS